MSTQMMIEAQKKAAQTIIPSRSLVQQHHSPFQVSIHAATTPMGSGAAQLIAQSCPLTAGPRACPFGGACHTCPAQVQAKLAIGQPGDEYEQEADRVSERVMRMPEDQVLQRQYSTCSKDEDKEALRAKALPEQVPSNAQGPEVPPIVHEVLRSSGQPLDPAMCAFMEPRFGHDFSQVRVHADPKAAKSAQAMKALAYTLGRNVVFGAGLYQPGIGMGRRLLAHELAHVVQQTKGAQVIQRRIVCDEFGENCQSVPDEEPGEQNYTPTTSPEKSYTPVEAYTPSLPKEKTYTPTETYTPAPAEEEVASGACTPGEERPVEGGREVCSEEGWWQSVPGEPGKAEVVPKPRSLAQPRSLTQTLDPSILNDSELELEIDEIRDWLRANPEEGEDRQKIERILAALESEAQQRIQDILDRQLDPALKKRIEELQLWLEKHREYWKLFNKEKIDAALAMLEGQAPPKCEKPEHGSHPPGLSPRAIDRLKAGEVGEGRKPSPSPYVASIGEDVCTIGYGHQMRLPKDPYCPVIHIESGKHWKELTKEEQNEVKKKEELSCDCNTTCDLDCAEKHLIDDKVWAINEVHKKLSAFHLTQDEFDAFVDISLAVGHFPSDLLGAMNSYWCTDEGKNYIRSYYMTTALKTTKGGTPQFSEETPGFIKRRQERVYPPLSEEPEGQEG